MAYEFSQAVNIDFTKVPSDLADYPVLINSTLAHLRTVGNGGSVRNANGYDIVFSLLAVNNPTVLPFEIEKYDATTGEIVAWVRLPSVSSSVTTTFYIVFGNTAVNTSQEDVPGTWKADYLSVYHLKDDAGVMGLLDSTSNGRDLTNISGIPAASTPVQINGGGDFATDAIGRYYSNTLPTPQTPFNPFPFTLAGWVECTSTPGFPPGFGDPWGIQGSSNQNVWRADLELVAPGTLQLNYVRHALAVHAFPLLQWALGDRVFIAITLDSLGTTVTGVLGDAGVFTTQSLVVPAVFLNTPPTNPGIGARDNSLLAPFIGLLDEPNFSTADLGVDWLEAQYNNQFSPSTFYSLGPVVPFVNPTPPVIVTGKSSSAGGAGILAFNVRLNAYDGCLINDRDAMEAISMYMKCPRTPDCFSMSERDWDDTPPGFKNSNPTGAIPLPDPVLENQVILSFEVPTGYDGMILGHFHGYTGTGFTQGSGDIVWRIRVLGNANAPRYLRDCANFTMAIGSSRQISPIHGGIQIRSGNLVQYVTSAPNTSGSLPLPGSGPRIFAGLHGYFYPRGYR